jgi:arylamine N-acetyltransferase
MQLQATHRHHNLAGDMIERFHRVLGVTGSGTSRAALCELVAAHVERVPCENLSTLYYRALGAAPSPPDPARYLDGVEHHHLGGTCRYVNTYFGRFLCGLGYDVATCGTNGHVVLVVTIEGREHLVDVGHGAPFFHPLPLDLEVDHVLALGTDRYVLRPRDKQGRSRVEFYRDGHLVLAYAVDPAARTVDGCGDASGIAHSVRFVRYLADGRSIALTNGVLIERDGRRSRATRVRGELELADLIEATFEVPHEIVETALGRASQ